MEPLESRRIQHACHEQDRIGTEGSRLPNLIFADDEILPQYRLGDMMPNRTKEFRASPKMPLIGQDGESANHGALFIGNGSLCHIFGTHRSHTRGAGLDFRNQAEIRSQSQREGTHGRSITDHSPQICLGEA